jgi:hypothetical protein
VYPSICVFWNFSDERGANFVELRKAEVQLLRTPLLRPPVNKGQKQGAKPRRTRSFPFGGERLAPIIEESEYL